MDRFTRYWPASSLCDSQGFGCCAGGAPSLRLLPSVPLRPEDDVALKWLLLKLTMADISHRISKGAKAAATAPTRGERHRNRYRRLISYFNTCHYIILYSRYVLCILYV